MARQGVMEKNVCANNNSFWLQLVRAHKSVIKGGVHTLSAVCRCTEKKNKNPPRLSVTALKASLVASMCVSGVS